MVLWRAIFEMNCCPGRSIEVTFWMISLMTVFRTEKSNEHLFFNCSRQIWPTGTDALPANFGWAADSIQSSRNTLRRITCWGARRRIGSVILLPNIVCRGNRKMSNSRDAICISRTWGSQCLLFLYVIQVVLASSKHFRSGAESGRILHKQARPRSPSSWWNILETGYPPSCRLVAPQSVPALNWFLMAYLEAAKEDRVSQLCYIRGRLDRMKVAWICAR